MTGDGTLEFRLLGPLEARLDEKPIALGGARQRGLLALLLLRANEVVSRDRLIDDLWRDHAPETAANALAALVARLRRVLPPNVLVTRSGGYEVQVEPDAIDVRRFERLLESGSRALGEGDPVEAAEQLRVALSLWRGAPLADFTYEPFAEPVILRLEELRVGAVETRIDADIALGRHTDLVGELQSLVLEHPLRERFRGQLMLALYQSGRQAEALETYRDGRRILLDELGIDPSPALQDLEKAILRQDPVVSAPELAAAGPARHAAATVERSAALTALNDSPAIADEVRPVTILFADVVGSTALGERLAPEETKALVGECVTIMSRAVEEYGGMVQAYQGDGICAYFGVPSAHENDPERAALAGLRILELMGEYTRDIEEAWGITGFTVRVGINSGRAAVGLVGAAEPQAVALGDATNVAARVQGAAEPGTILVGDTAARRLTHRFVLEPLGEIVVKGREAPVVVSRLVRPASHEPGSPTKPCVGREREIAVLDTVVDDLVSGRGRIVILSGAAGIGKTRLVAELRSRAGERVTWLEGHCLSYGGLPPWPFMEILLGWLAAEAGEPEIAVRTKARARLGALLGDELDEVLASLGLLLRIRQAPAAGSSEPNGIPKAYLRWLEALAAEQPVIVVVEDIQWADVPTRELAEAVLELTDRAGLALVLTDEPIAGSEGATLRLRTLSDYSHRATELTLGPLTDEAAAHFLAGMLEEDIDSVSREQLIREAEGNPLYLEELARALDEGSLESRGRTWTITMRSPELLPPTLENLLVARIDRLAAGPRRLAQTAAALGRTFPVDVLARVTGEDAADDLAALFRTEIVRELRRYPEFECSFTHGLLQDAALSTLTATGRRDLYARVAAAFEEHYAGSLDDHAERLAHYHAQAGNLPKALEYAERARRGQD
ncbi:MAG TPA: BTAD domain-containing putative transcriptional regulator [Gaiellaceae bacterium]|nr:BTAD domain-containing putative transcriptional regulator [Gaiellaceae bacterium]